MQLSIELQTTAENTTSKVSNSSIKVISMNSVSGNPTSKLTPHLTFNMYDIL